MLLAINNSYRVNLTIRLMLVLLFVSVFPSGKTALSLCLDDEQTHLVQQQHLHLVDCHNSSGQDQPETPASRFSLVGEDEKSCVDVTLSTYNSTTRRQRTSLTIPAPILCGLALVTIPQQMRQPAEFSRSSLLAQSSSLSLSVDVLRTVVLLI